MLTVYKRCIGICLRYHAAAVSLFQHARLSSAAAASTEEFSRGVELQPKRQKRKASLTPETVQNSRFMRVAILGMPNAGKSLLTNALLEVDVCGVSKKINTTRRMMNTVLVGGPAQLVLLDTPGIATGHLAKAHKLAKSLVVDPEMSLKRADLILVVIDASDRYRGARISPRVLHLLCRYCHLASVLVLNKIDLVKDKAKLLEVINTLSKGVVDGKRVRRKASPLMEDEQELRDIPKMLQRQPSTSTASQDVGGDSALSQTDKNPVDIQRMRSLTVDLNVDPAVFEKVVSQSSYEVPQMQLHKCFRHEFGWPHFRQVFMVSALLRDGTEDLKRYLLDIAPPGKWKYHSSVVTDEDSSHLVADALRSKALDVLPQEVPYGITCKVDLIEVNEVGTLCIWATLICKEKRQLKVVIGHKGAHLIQIAKDASQELRNLFQNEVHIRLNVASAK